MGTDIDYSSVSHETIYQNITGGSGATGMTEASRAWQDLAAKLRDLHGAVQQAVGGIGAAQQGAAADATTHATMALLPWLDSSVAAANATAARVAEQADYFGHTRDNMPKPIKVPEVSFTQDPGTWIGDHAVEWLPGIQTEHERDQVVAQQAQQRARELMSAYQSSSNANLTASQQFAAAPAVMADVSQPATSGPAAGGPGPDSPVVHSAHPAVRHAGPAPTSPAPAGTGRQMATHNTPEGLTGAPADVPAVATPPQLAGGYPAPPSQLVAELGSITPAAAAGLSAMPLRASSGRPRGAATAGFGPRPSAWLGEEAARHGGALPTTTAEHAGAGKAVRGGAGWEGAPLGATGGSAPDADIAHRRPSYLVEHDTNAIVGELPRTAPPVIGADG